MKISEKEFINCFNKNVFKKIVNETSIPYKEKITWKEFKCILSELYNELKNGNYGPDAPRNFLQLHKTLYVARNIPLLSVKDEALYYFIAKYLESDIAENRVQNTFGGWKLGNALKTKEINDIEEIQYVFGSYNPTLWSKNWKEFSRISASFALSKQYPYVIKLDIANFYDSINLNILYNKLINHLQKKKVWVLDYLMFFIKHWNKKIDNYMDRTSGLPQTEFGDQSRLLANFYLQDYDLHIHEICKSFNAEYVRYADDQLIFLKNKNWQDIMYLVNMELNKIGLNLNASKTKFFKIKDLIKYNLYKEQLLLDSNDYNKSFTSFYKLYNKEKKDIRYDIYLHRIFSKAIGLDKLSKSNQKKVIQITFNKEFLVTSNYRTLNNIYANINQTQKSIFLKLLFSYVKEVRFNSYYYTLLKFFEQNKLTKEKNRILSLINN